MNFDLNQLLQGPVRDLLLNQVTKKFGVSNEVGSSLLNKGLSMVLGGMTEKASSVEGIRSLFDLIKNSPFQGNPLDLITGKSELNGSNLLELGKKVLPSLFGDRADVITQHLAETTNSTPVAAKGMFGMLLPIVFSAFKNKILNGMGLGGFANLLSEQAKSFSSNLDSKSLSVLGFSAASFSDVLSNFGKVTQAVSNLGTLGVGAPAAASTAATAQKAPVMQKVAEVEQSEKSSGIGKWLLAGGVLLAALFGIKTCSDNKADMVAAPVTQPIAQTEKTSTPVLEEVKITDGLGNLSWNKTDKDFTVSGTVQSDGIKSSLLDAFKGLAGDLPLVDKLTVDAKAPQFNFNNFAGLAGLFKDFPNVQAAFSDKVFNLSGSVVSEDAKSGLVEKVKSLLGSAFSVNADKVNVDTPVAKLVDGLGNLGWLKGEKDFTVSGTVQNEDVKTAILNAFKGLAGDLPLVDKLVVDDKAEQSNFDNFTGLTDVLKAFPGVSGAFADKALNLVGQVVTPEMKTALVEKTQAVLGSAFSVNADKVNADAPVAKLVDGLGNLGWSKGEKDFAVSGIVQNEGVKADILDAFKGLAGDLPLVDKLVVDDKAAQFKFGNFAGLTEVLKAFPSVSGLFADKALNLVGQVATPEMKTSLVEKTQAVLDDVFLINAEGVTVAEVAKEPPVLADMSAAKLDLDIVFSTGSSEIEARYYKRLNAFAKFLVEHNRGGEIVGYTDNVGDAESNQSLSEKRAHAVREYLVKQGVPAEALTAVGYGHQNPIADNSTKEGRDKNRRIEFNAR